jgi:4-hydroxybenzoate polyprenyltransferase
MLPGPIRLLRPGDWTKNAFVLVPLVFWLAGDGRGETDAGDEVRNALLTAIAFCMAGSGFYSVNDALDADEDRRHPVKCRRPVASGEVAASTAVAIGLALIAGALALAWWVRPAVLGVIGTYVALQVAYNARLKRVRLVDVVTVAAGFVLRAVAGALAIGIGVSTWLVVVVYALTLFLGFVKRLGDLRAAEVVADAGWRPRAGYGSAEDLNWLLAVTGAVTMMAYLVYALSDHARAIFGVRATGLALLAPLVFVVIHRLYLRANQGKADSPVAAVIADGAARAATALFAAGVGVVLFWPPAEQAIAAVFR